MPIYFKMSSGWLGLLFARFRLMGSGKPKNSFCFRDSCGTETEIIFWGFSRAHESNVLVRI